MIIIEAEDTVLCLAHHIINALMGMQKSQKKNVFEHFLHADSIFNCFVESKGLKQDFAMQK